MTRYRGVDGREAGTVFSCEGCNDAEIIPRDNRNGLTLIVDNGREGFRSTAALRPGAATLLVSASSSGPLASDSSIVRAYFGC